ncbi:MAG: filamentous hemagglutinin N-terminal domain-containing protein [Xenococcaceae cyanobacterium MO_188.B19]|nr:filamentous hemagglutinin N-terminal domain-containing protein [Xenococcaceae cyanobacterium MO_188.B19]
MPFCQSFRTIFSLLFLATINPGIAQAQVVPDNTLRTFVEQLENMIRITGGETFGNNLFHSLDEFSIPEGVKAIFENALDIENIFTRVTGGSISNIEGIIEANGTANFFLINPNGIVFGKNAQLNIGGSFLATTADSIEFADGKIFSAIGGDKKPILTVSPAIGLRLRGNNGSITVNGIGNNIINDSNFSPIEFSERPEGISTNDSQTLALVSNGINLNGGVVGTESGNIYLTSIESGSVGIEQSENGLTLTDNAISKYQDINLNQQSLVDASGEKIGTVSVIGKNINFNNASALLLQNQGDTSSGSINLKAIESVTFSGTSSGGDISSLIRSEALNMGEGADIDVVARKLIIQDRSTIQASTFSDTVEATGGDINLNISEKIELDGGLIAASTLGKGNAGNLQLSTPQLELNNSGLITSATVGTGNGGKVIIDADFIELDGSTTSTINRTNISASSLLPNSGNAGDIIITSKKIRITDGASLSSSSFAVGNAGDIIINASEFVEVEGISQDFQGSNTTQSIIRTSVQVATPARQERLGLPAIPTGDAGNLTINTPSLNVAKAGVISVENQGTGIAGKLTINADNLNLDESANITGAAESGVGGNIELNTTNLNISNDSQITSAANGNKNGGNITIFTTNLNAKKNSQITASSFEGDGGNIIIDANDSIFLKDQSNITATSEFGNGGNIDLNSDRIQIENNSNISARAGGEGNGGNIDITGNTVLALNDSDVVASAIQGNGGNIRIDADALLGTEERKATPGNGTSDADASSEFGQDGTVVITNPQSNIQDPIVVVKEIRENNIQRKTQSRCVDGKPLFNDGRHSDLHETPDNMLDTPEYFPSDNFIPPSKETNESKSPRIEDLVWSEGDPLIPGNQIVVTENGRVFVVVKSQLESLQQNICSSTVTEK